MPDLDAWMPAFVLVMFPFLFGGVISLIWFSFKIIRTLFLEHYELWEKLGCPGAGMWGIPRRRGIWEDNRATNRFWRDKWFRLKEEYRTLFPEDMLRLFRRFYRVSRIMAVFTIIVWVWLVAIRLSEMN